MPTRREALTALESVMWALMVWRGSWDSEVEDFCYQEIRRLADESFKRLGAQNMLTLQTAVMNLLKEKASATGPVVDVPASGGQERTLRSVAVQGQEVGVSVSGGGAVEDGSEAEVAGGSEGGGPGLEDP